jgi:hypothetical protein
MDVVIRFSEKEELKALAILLRHSPGRMLPDRVDVVSEQAALALTEGGVTFTRLGAESLPPILRVVARGEEL